MSRWLPTLAAMTICLAFTGCTTWQVVDSTPLSESKYAYEFQAPADWYLSPFKTPDGGRVFTRDGTPLQLIVTARTRHKRAFQALEKDSSPDMLPQDLAETFVANLKAQLANDTIEVLSSEPVSLGGQPGIRLYLEYKNDSGLRYRSVYYAASVTAGLYTVRFEAPALHYFDRHIDEFELSVASFRFL